jgi:hypothetical protein
MTTLPLFARIITAVNTCNIPMGTLTLFVRVITAGNTCNIPMTTLTLFVRIITAVKSRLYYGFFLYSTSD